jgi:hypothetical protein
VAAGRGGFSASLVMTAFYSVCRQWLNPHLQLVTIPLNLYSLISAEVLQLDSCKIKRTRPVLADLRMAELRVI